MHNTIKQMKEQIQVVRERLSDQSLLEIVDTIHEGVETLEWHLL